LRNLTRLARWSQILIIAGILSILAATWFNRPSVWRPLVVDASATDSDTIDVRLVAGREYEVSLEVDRQTTAEVTRQLIARKPQHAIAAQWVVACQGKQIAAGELANYIRINNVASWRGELYRLVARVPFGVDEARYWGFGLTGSYLGERVVGAFRIPDDVSESCEFSWAIERPADTARIALRKTEQDWRKHSRQSAFLPIGGALAVLLGSFVLLVRGLIALRSRRDASPATRH
jgi:hypothetical protein